MSGTLREHGTQLLPVRKLIPVLWLLFHHWNLTYKTCTRLSRRCRRRWIDCSQITPVLRINMGWRFSVVVVHTTFWTCQVRRIETCVGTSRIFGLYMIENLLSLDVSAEVCKPGWTFMVVAVKHPVSHFMSRMSGKRPIEVDLYRLAWVWGQVYRSALECSWWVPQFVNESVNIHRTCILKLVSSVSEHFELKSHAYNEVFCPPGRSSTASGADTDPQFAFLLFRSLSLRSVQLPLS